MGKLFTVIKTHILPAILLTFSAVSVLVSGLLVYKAYSYNEVVELVTKEQIQPVNKKNKESHKIIVDVSGAVLKSGPVELNEGSRLSEALKKSGGLARGAAYEYFQKTFNLSAILKDEEKIYIPTQKEIDQQESQKLISQPALTENNTDVNDPISINQASQ